MTNFIKQKTKTLVMHKATNYIFMTLIFAVAISYVYFANIAVHALTVLEKTRQHMQSLSVEVSEMESKRLAIENNFSTEKVLSLGFTEVTAPIFILKNSVKTTLSFKID
ncbi:MAG: hypothetical protein V1896_01560 [Candidatus Zambryskibacteria bacterium]